MPDRHCPGCGGRGFTVSLMTMIPCARCHGSGRETEAAREERQRQIRERHEAFLRENDRWHQEIVAAMDVLHRVAEGDDAN